MARWVFHPAIIDDELLTSYLARTAQMHGLSAYRFCAYHFPGIPIWDRDFDRSAPHATLQAIAAFSGLAEQAIFDMTLAAYVPFAHHSDSSTNIIPWINACGIHHRVRKRYALQYCPACLAEEEGFKRRWRLSFVVACEKHTCLLADACPVCDAAIIPHRASISIRHCHQCGTFLARTAQSNSCDDLLVLIQAQKLMLNALQMTLMLEGQEITIAKLYGIRQFVLATRKRIKKRADHLPKLQALPSLALEFMRLSDRLTIMRFVADIIRRKDAALFELADELGMTQTDFASAEPLTEWMATFVPKLPIRRAPAKETDKALRGELQRLQRHRTDNWRSRHAQILLDLAEAKRGH